MKQKQTCMHSGSRPSPEGTRLLFAGDKVSPTMCPADGQQKNDKNGQTNTAKMRAEIKPEKTRLRVDRNEVVAFRLIWICAWCFEVIRCMWYRKIYRDTSWHHVPYHAISQDTVHRDIVSYLYPDFFELLWRYRIPSNKFLDTEHNFLPVRCTKTWCSKRAKEMVDLAIVLYKQCDIHWKVYLTWYVKITRIYLRVYRKIVRNRNQAP